MSLAKARSAASRDLLEPPSDGPWTVSVEGVDPALEPLRDVRLAMVDGVAGTLGSPLVAYPPARREVFVAGVYSCEGSDSRLLVAEDWTGLAGRLDERATVSRVLDMRTGLLHHDLGTDNGRIEAVSFASRARPGIGALRARGPGVRGPGMGRRSGTAGATAAAPATSSRIRGARGGAVVGRAETVTGRGESRCLDRIVAVRSGGRRLPREAGARAFLAGAHALGFDRLLAEQETAWAARWADADILLEGDADMQRAIRFALYQLMAHAVERGESAIGARGVTGPKYRGHVFWDTDVFVLPFYAAVRPRAARAVLEYRIRRLPAARAAARAAGLAGARFPWESAADGSDVTPDSIPRPGDVPLQVMTGPYEIHITADVAWAAATYFDWTGDLAFARGPGAELMFETARYWASRIETAADGSAHITDVTGPDEYHDHVADNAYTNAMARWNLRRAAGWEVGAGLSADQLTAAERSSWLDLAERLADGFDSGSGVYEQFHGYFDLEPVRIAELAARPLSGEVFLGRERVAATQCLKQPDVLMLYHLIPDQLRVRTLEANLGFYDPRTSHGSSLSPGVHAALLARAGRTEDALAALRMVAFIDLDDRSRGTAEGLHMAALGSLWQAIVFGFAGVRLDGGGLALEPHLHSAWRVLEVPVLLRGRRVRIRIEQDRLRVWAERPVAVRIAGLEPVVADRNGVSAVRRDSGWSLGG
jgi:trehalose/maltose hydrolase-like predicted phosphorylase